MVSFATPRRTKAMLAQVCGVVTILALVVAPACAPLCAAKVCSRGLASEEVHSPCHVMATARGSATSARAAQNCGALELPEAAPSSTGKNEWLRSRFEAFGVGLDIPTVGIFPASAQAQDHCLGCTISPQEGSSLSLTGVLRI